MNTTTSHHAGHHSESRLQAETILQRAPGLTFELDSSNCVRVLADGQRLMCGLHGLAILEAFARPRRLRDALDQFQAQGRKDWMDLSATVLQLFRAGVLRDVTQAAPHPDLRPSSYGAAPIHIEMLNDRQRTELFIAGLNQVVRPGDVVVDIGTGSGVLAAAAARAGAARVYAVEASGIADVAQAVFAANAVADRVTVIRGWSTQIELPERADVLVSEMIGHDPLGEHLLPITIDARQRLLKPNARLVPSRLRVFALPVTIPPSHLHDKLPDAPALARWREWYGLDLSPLADIFQPDHGPLFRIRPQHARDWPALADPALLAEFDLGTFEQQNLDRTISGRATTTGRLNGALIFFEAQLGSVTLSTHPRAAQQDNHWRSPVWWFEAARELQPGAAFAFRYQCFFQHQSATLRLTDPPPLA
jgi:2-polyprenyl-3-methyl-5-hydroxy-6-metoxy-1,4-benzoquinol methylase